MFHKLSHTSVGNTCNKNILINKYLFYNRHFKLLPPNWDSPDSLGLITGSSPVSLLITTDDLPGWLNKKPLISLWQVTSISQLVRELWLLASLTLSDLTAAIVHKPHRHTHTSISSHTFPVFHGLSKNVLVNEHLTSSCVCFCEVNTVLGR